MLTRRALFATPLTALAAVQQDLLTKAMDSVRAAIPLAAKDPERPVYHFHPPAYWNNDPNGTIFHNGWHHLFYQHNPYGAEWGHMHWGHARSRNLIDWEHLPIALPPSLDKGERHVFSGAAVLRDGVPVLFYTSIGDRAPEQWLATPLDDELITWAKHPANPILTTRHHGALEVHEWRDPFLFVEAGRTYMVCGGNLDPAGGAAAVLLYEARNRELTEWAFLGPVYTHRQREVWNFECPNLFQLEGKWVLLVSPHRPCEYFIGALDLARRRFLPETQGVLDPGSSYASNISTDAGGRTLLWLWGRTATNPAKGWNGAMALPRVLSIGADGYLRQAPAAELATLRGEPWRVEAAALTTSRPLEARGDTLELHAEFSAGKASEVGLRLRCGAAGTGLTVACAPGAGRLTVGTVRASLPRGLRRVSLQVLLDRRVVEVFAAGGAAAVFSTVDAAPDALGVEVYAKGGEARLESLTAWPLRPARFSLERFRL
jgi:beta-fructofuranosidase